ncbi:four helix bundle protein [Pontiellaceae bacterium B12219]|nr:four helix bundle protein [Pontiellaceae bacterium B12219]
MKGDELKERTKTFVLRIMKLVDAPPNTIAGRTIANQIMRFGSSVGANYRAACRARSNKGCGEFPARNSSF